MSKYSYLLNERLFLYVHSNMSSFPRDFEEIGPMFLKFDEELNTARGSSLVGDNLGESNNAIHFNFRLFQFFLTLYVLIIY